MRSATDFMWPSSPNASMATITPPKGPSPSGTTRWTGIFPSATRPAMEAQPAFTASMAVETPTRATDLGSPR